MADEAERVVRKSIVVARDAAGAFAVWTEQIGAWWPAGHSLSGDPLTTVLMEGWENGRVYERTADGREYEWGRVLVWEPPMRLVHTWYLGSGQALPSEVAVAFVPLGEQQTRIELTHRGPELIGELWWQRVALFAGAWGKILPLYGAHAARAGESF